MKNGNSFNGIDPIQVENTCCGGGLAYNIDTGEWEEVIRPIPKHDSETANQLADAQAEIAKKDATIAEMQRTLDTAKQTIADKDNAIKAKDARIAELEARPDCPSECDVLAKYLRPVRDLDGDVVYYGFKPGMSCPGLENANAESVGGEDVPAVNPNGGGTTPTTPSKSNNDGTGDNPETTPDHDFNASAEPVLLGGDGSTNRPVIRGEEGRYYALDEADGKWYESDANGGFIEPRREM